MSVYLCRLHLDGVGTDCHLSPKALIRNAPSREGIRSNSKGNWFSRACLWMTVVRIFYMATRTEVPVKSLGTLSTYAKTVATRPGFGSITPIGSISDKHRLLRSSYHHEYQCHRGALYL